MFTLNPFEASVPVKASDTTRFVACYLLISTKTFQEEIQYILYIAYRKQRVFMKKCKDWHRLAVTFELVALLCVYI